MLIRFISLCKDGHHTVRNKTNLDGGLKTITLNYLIMLYSGRYGDHFYSTNFFWMCIEFWIIIHDFFYVCAIDENNIGAHKIQNIFGTFCNCLFFNNATSKLTFSLFLFTWLSLIQLRKSKCCGPNPFAFFTLFCSSYNCQYFNVSSSYKSSSYRSSSLWMPTDSNKIISHLYFSIFSRYLKL